jgi:hypothetical protein
MNDTAAEGTTIMSAISNITNPPDPQTLARRLSILEKEVERLKRQRKPPVSAKNWWQAIAGKFDDDPVYEDIVNEGKKWRQSQRRAARPSRKPTKGGSGGANSPH